MERLEFSQYDLLAGINDVAILVRQYPAQSFTGAINCHAFVSTEQQVNKIA